MSDRDFKDIKKNHNSNIKGPSTDAVLESVSRGTKFLRENVESINDQIYISTATGRFLEDLLADRNIVKPDNVGLGDDVFREIGIEVSNRKQVRDLILKLLEIIYGPEFTRATMRSAFSETYELEDGDDLILQFDEAEPVRVFFFNNDFTDISKATAQEVADTISTRISQQGRQGTSFARNDGTGSFVVLLSSTLGPASSIKVLGGKAQNKLQFPDIRPVSGSATTEWTLTQVDGGSIRATWTGGPSPSIGKARVGDYVNIYSTNFQSVNRGTFTVNRVSGGLVGDAFIEYVNPNGVPETVTQGDSEGVLIYNAKRQTIISRLEFATAYQTESRLLELFFPATTRVIRRDRAGAAHLNDDGLSGENQRGPYLYDEFKPYVIGEQQAQLTQKVDASTELVVSVDDSSAFPDTQGNLVFGFGTSKEEGPIPYIGRPSPNSFLIDPSYNFQEVHEQNTVVSLVAQNFGVEVATDGSDFPFYVTDVVSGRLYAQDLIESVAASGINLSITILYPNDIGLGKWGTENSEKVKVWGL